jgi:hypothetical protein
MIRSNPHRLFRLLFIFCCILLQTTAFAQDDDVQKRIVESRKVFICTMSDRDTFKTAEEGCKHWAEKHLPAGYKYNSLTVSENGAVKCICKKPGNADNDQQGKIYGIIICPEYSYVYSKNNDDNYKELACACYSGYLPDGKICVKDSCADYEKMGEDGLKGWITNKLQQFCNEENEAFKNDPEGKINPKGEPPIITNNEAATWADWGGKIAPNGNKTYSDKVWPMVYGHAIERMVARRIEKDECLKKYVAYVKNTNQMKEEGTNPDFKGKGKLPAEVEFDITTAEEASKKMNDASKAHFIFITYSRLFTSDDLAEKAPKSPQTPPKNTGNPKTPTDPKKPVKPAKPKSSTDGR